MATDKSDVDVLTSVLSAMTVRHHDDNLVTQRPAATLKEILEKIRANKDQIRELDLKDMAAKKRKLRSPGGDLVGRVFQLNRTVLRLLLPGHEIEDVGAKSMGNMLRTNNTLQHLDLRGNEITAEGARAISDALYGHESLEHLGLSSNKLGDEGAKAVAQMLPYNISLKYLGLANNGIGEEGGKALLEAVLQNRSLVMVQLVKNDIPRETLDKIRSALVVNKLMQKKAQRDEEKEQKKYEETEKELARMREEALSNHNEEDSSSDEDEDDESLKLDIGSDGAGRGWKPLMSLEEMKEGMFQSIRDNGTVELIRVRASAASDLGWMMLTHFLYRHNFEDNSSRNCSSVPGMTIEMKRTTLVELIKIQRALPDEKLVHGLVANIWQARDWKTHLLYLYQRSEVHETKWTALRSWRYLVYSWRCVALVRLTIPCLRRVENSYLVECAAQKLEPQKSLEERMVQYQREYDEICDKRLQEEMERYRSTEVALVRAEERKRFNREVDNLRASLLQEYRSKQERLQEQERELELAFVARRTELETSLFETRQSLFKDMERLRVKEAELQVKVKAISATLPAKLSAFSCGKKAYRQQALADIQTKQDELADRERTLTTETGTLKTLKTQVVALQQEVGALEAALSKSGDEVRIASSSALQLDKDRQRLEERVADLEIQLGEQKNSLVDVNAANARFAADTSLVTTAIVAERKKFMQVMDEERERSQWKENELLAKLREMQSRLAESEALAEKYQSQYEDEKLHVESLRHDVSSLNSLLTQAQATINAKHGARERCERTFMMKMMEMMANFQDRGDNTQQARAAPHMSVHQNSAPQPATTLPVFQPRDEDQEETKRLKEDQARIERELTEQREYEKKKQTQKEEQERELAEQHREFEEKLACLRRERIEEEERMEELRKRKQVEEEAKLQEDLARQRAAVHEAAELQQKLVEQRLTDEKQRLQEEQAYTERIIAEEQKFNEEIEAKRQQQLEDELAVREIQEREAEEERVRQEHKAQEEQERIRLEQQQAVAHQTALRKQEEDRQRDEELRLAEEERKRKEAGHANTETVEEEASWQESSVEDDDADSNHSEEKSGSVVDEITVEIRPVGNAEEHTTNDVHSDSEEAAEESVASASSHGSAQGDIASDIPTTTQDPPAKTPEEEDQERQKAAEEAKKKEDENVIDVYRQRVLARKAAEKQRQLELEAESERKAKEEEERQRAQLLEDASESDQELELSGGSFAESSGDSSSVTDDGDRVRSSLRSSREADDFNYREERSRGSFRENDRPPRRSISREESQRPYEARATRTPEFDRSSLSSGRSTIGGSTLNTDFTSIGSSRDRYRGDSSVAAYISDQDSRQDNQREVDDFIHRDHSGASRWDEPRRSGIRSHDRPQRVRAADSSSYSRARTSLRYGQSDNYAESILSNDKVDSIRGAESPVAASVKTSRNEDNGYTRTAPEIKSSSLTSSFENQDEQHLSRTNSETSIPPASPHSDDAQRTRDRYPKLSIPSPVPTDRSSDRRRRPSSPSSSDSMKCTVTSRGFSTMAKHPNPSQRPAQPAMSDLRENLYAFRKQMREVFIRVEDMVDLADLRQHFSRLAKDFQRSEMSADEWSVPKTERRTRLPVSETSSRLKQAPHTASSRSSDDESNSVKDSEHPEDVGSERLSVTSENNDEASNMEHSPSIRHASQDSSDDDIPTVPNSASTNLSQLQSRWRKNSSAGSESIAMSDISAPLRWFVNPCLTFLATSTCHLTFTDLIDFDKRMEQIRCSLNAIANGKKRYSTIATFPALRRHRKNSR
ncbi:Leucine-rich repeat domain, L domain-like [Phytophthora cactorum]|nr:Leucine-rich repeat domain, L domain-like [Phytophthora cactorum]